MQKILLFREEQTAILFTTLPKSKKASKKWLQLTKTYRGTLLSIMSYPLRFAVIQTYDFENKMTVFRV